jgi:glutathione S-transferase
MMVCTVWRTRTHIPNTSSLSTCVSWPKLRPSRQAQAQAEQAQIQNRLTLTVEQLAISLGGLRAEVGEVAKIQRELAESQAHTEDRLNALLNYFERHLNEHDQ